MEGIRDRFKGTLWYQYIQEAGDYGLYTIVGGVGGIGSWVSFFLSRAEIQHSVYDDDIVEEHNLSGQAFGLNHINKSKVNAVSKNALQFSNFKAITENNERYTTESSGGHVMFACFDNIAARKDMLTVFKETIQQEGMEDSILVDIRLTVSLYQIFIVTKDNIKEYDTYSILPDDADIPDGDCTAKQCTHVAAMSAAHAVSLVTNYLTNIKLGKKAFTLPFFTQFNVPNMHYTNDNVYATI